MVVLLIVQQPKTRRSFGGGMGVLLTRQNGEQSECGPIDAGQLSDALLQLQIVGRHLVLFRVFVGLFQQILRSSELLLFHEDVGHDLHRFDSPAAKHSYLSGILSKVVSVPPLAFDFEGSHEVQSVHAVLDAGGLLVEPKFAHCHVIAALDAMEHEIASNQGFLFCGQELGNEGGRAVELLPGELPLVRTVQLISHILVILNVQQL